jgi:ankyrin repeat protein
MGADINTPRCRYRGLTALQNAALEGRIDVVEELRSAGADVNVPGSYFDNQLALHAAADGGHLNIGETLLVAGAQVEAISGNRKQTAF